MLDETRAWSAWADALEVPRLTLMAVLGGVIARGGDHRESLALLRPDVDIPAMLRNPETAHLAEVVEPSDLYPDALPCLQTLIAAGYRVGIAGNQPSRTEAVLRDLGLSLAFVGSSESLGAEKPDPAFFERIAAALQLPPGEIAYVGDRLDNDVTPAAAAGMIAVFLRRGPWAWIQAGRSDPLDADLVIDDLVALPVGLASLGKPINPTDVAEAGDIVR